MRRDVAGAALLYLEATETSARDLSLKEFEALLHDVKGPSTIGWDDLLAEPVAEMVAALWPKNTRRSRMP